jgi:hypothetical protein
MLLDSSSAVTVPAPGVRRWHRAPKAPLPPEPGRLQTNALLNVARHARGCHTRGDDRLETRAYAVKRLLWRWGHAQRSGHYACSVGQLVVALAPIMGWGRPPPGRAARKRWIRAHAHNVRRWLDDLQAAGIITYSGERDNRGQRWRTLITLHAAPQAPADELQVAKRRMAAWARRRRLAARRERRGRPRGRRLEGVRRGSQRPQRSSRRRLAARRARTVHESRRRAQVERQLAGCDQTKLRTHHFVASPTVKNSPTTSTPIEASIAVDGRQTLVSSEQSRSQPATSVAETGASAREYPNQPVKSAQRTDSTENQGDLTPARSQLDALQERIAARASASAWRRRTAALQALQRARSLAASSPGRGWGLGDLREAWVVFRFGPSVRDEFLTPISGPERIGDHGSADAGPRRPGQQQRAVAAAALYEQHTEHRPPGWPATGAGALCALAAQGRAATLEGDIARLLILARDMRACSLLQDDDRSHRMTARAARRTAAADDPAPRLGRRVPPRFETAEQRRLRLRDELLLAGENPGHWTIAAALAHRFGLNVAADLIDPDVDKELDGTRARQRRYADELRQGRWELSPQLAERAAPTPDDGRQ